MPESSSQLGVSWFFPFKYYKALLKRELKSEDCRCEGRLGGKIDRVPYEWSVLPFV